VGVGVNISDVFAVIKVVLKKKNMQEVLGLNQIFFYSFRYHFKIDSGV